MSVSGTVFRRVLRNTFWDAYDFLGTLVVASLLFWLLGIWVLPLPFALAGLVGMARRIAADRDASLSDFFCEAKAGWKHHAGVLLLNVFVLVVLASNVLFYSGLGRQWRSVGVVMCVFAMWAGVFYFLGQPFVIPALSRPDVPLSRAVKYGYMVALACPGIAVAAALHVAAISALLLLSGFGFLLLWPGVMALLLCHTLNVTEDELHGRPDPRAGERRCIADLFHPWQNHA